MAYQVNDFNGTLRTTVEDGTIDTTTDLRFVGKNYAGYGEIQNENFLHLMENFANTTQPPKVIEGQIWYDSGNKKLRFYDGSKFKITNGAEVSATAPSGLGVGEFWWDSSTKQLYTYTGTDYVLVGPQSSPDLGTSAVLAQVVKDTLGNNNTIVKVIAGGKTVAIASQTEFTLNSTINPIQDFSLIKKGLTLVKTNTDGVSSEDHFFWGTASDSLRLGGILAENYLQKDDIVFNNEISFKDPGFSLGNDNDLRVRVENSDEVIIENRLGNPITMRITVTDNVDERDVAIFNQTGVVPGADSVYDLGTTGSKWKDIYATTVHSNLTGNVTGNSAGVHTGNVRATDLTTIVDATTKTFYGTLGSTITPATVFGSVQGNLTGTATNATLLVNFAPSIAIPSIADKTSVLVRNADGDAYARKFVGTSDKTDRLKIDNSATDTDASYRSAKTTATANTIAARDSAGDLYAVIFQGTATAARYADLAEKYLADAEYEPGTVVCVGGEKEVTASSSGKRALGVVSTNPAYMMNSELEGGTYIALKGRVPVKVHGPVNKGDSLIAGENGTAIAWNSDSGNVFAIALESNDSPEIKLVEAVVL